MPTLGTLFLVATPIGNLGDLTARAPSGQLRVMRSTSSPEDTRRTRQLLTHLGIAGKPVERLDAHADARHVERVAARLAGGERIALVTDARTPEFERPRARRSFSAAIAGGAAVVPVPGASAVLAAIVASGLAGDGRFRFVGFLPRDGSARREAIAMVCETPETVVLFEAPSRVRATLRDLGDAHPGPPRRASPAGAHEGARRSSCALELAAHLAADEREWRIGEIVLVLGAHSPADRSGRVDDAALDARIDEALARGDHARTVAERLAAWSGRPRREVYERVVERKIR